MANLLPNLTKGPAAEPKAPDENFPGQNILASYSQGASLGFSDELAGGLGAVTEFIRNGMSLEEAGKAYRGVRDAARKRQQQFAASNPKTDIAAQLVGGVGSGALLGGPATALGLAKTGAGFGAVAGAGYSDTDVATDPLATLKDTAIGAGLGVATGVAAPVLARTVGAVATAPVRAAKAARATLAERKILQALQRDGISPADAAVMVKEMGPEATLSDLLTPGLRNLSERITTQPGAGASKAIQYMTNRQLRQHTSVDSALRTGMASPQEFYPAVENLQTQMRTIAKPLYDQAYATPMDLTPKLRAFLDDPSVKKAWSAARRIHSADVLAGEIDPTPLKYVATFKNGNVKMLDNTVTAREWDYLKRGLDDMIEGQIDGVTGRTTTLGRSLIKMKNAMLAEVDAQNPAFAAARKAYADPAANMTALRNGERSMRQDPELVEQTLKGMSESEKQFFRIGAMQALKRRINESSYTTDAFNTIFKSKGMRDRIAAVFPDRQSYQKFEQAMLNEHRMSMNSRELMGGSQTARRLAAQQDNSPLASVGELLGAGIDAATGNKIGLLRKGANLVGSAAQKLTNPNEAQRDAIAEILFASGGDRDRVLRALLDPRLTTNRILPQPYRPGSVMAAEVPRGLAYAGRALPPLVGAQPPPQR